MGKKRTIWDDIRGDDTFKNITHGLGDSFTGGISFLNNIRDSGRKFLDTTTNFFTGDGFYLIIGVAGPGVAVAGYSAITRK